MSRLCDRCRAELVLDDLRRLAVAHRLGALVNAVDDLAMLHGPDALPESAHRLAGGALDLLEDLGITDGRHPLAADTYRSEQ